MEIHAPEGHIQSLRDVAIHLAIVTAGILIALGLEQTVEWFHHRELAAEARENILSEMRDNKKELDSYLGRIADARKNHLGSVRVIDDYLAHGKSDSKSLSIGVSIADIRDTSWTTAQTIGALNYMPYAEIKKYASIYGLQQQFARLQDRTMDSVVASVSMFAENKGPDKLSRAELETERAKLLDTVAQITAETQIATALDKAYALVIGADKRTE